MRIIDEENKGVHETTKEITRQLRAKFPKGPEMNELPKPEPTDGAEMTKVDKAKILRAITQIHGSGGRSHIDAANLKRMLLSKSFGNEASRLAENLAKADHHLATEDVKENYTKIFRGVRNHNGQTGMDS